MSIATTFTTLWDKVVAWVKGEIVVIEHAITAEEQIILKLVQPILAAAAPQLVAELTTEAKAFLVGLEHVGSLEDVESALLNVWETEKPALFSFAKGLGSNIFQSIIGLLLSQLPKVAAAAL